MPLRRMVSIYSNNIFIWIDENIVDKKYIKKILFITEKQLSLFKLKINKNEIIYVY